jgi:hypothetical protein
MAMLMTNRKRRGSEWALPPRACVGMLVVLLSGLVAGCIVPLTAEVHVGQIRDVQAPSGGIALSVLFSRDFSPETSRSLGEEMVECVTRDLAKVAPDVRLVPEEEFYRAIFELKLGEVLLRADTIGTLLARPDIRQRVSQSGLTHLILVGGATHSHSGRLVDYGLGFEVSSTRSTRLTASIFELASGNVGLVEVTAQGSQGVGVFGVPFVELTRTESPSCQALGAEVARAISGKARDESH